MKCISNISLSTLVTKYDTVKDFFPDMKTGIIGATLNYFENIHMTALKEGLPARSNAERDFAPTTRCEDRIPPHLNI